MIYRYRYRYHDIGFDTTIDNELLVQIPIPMIYRYRYPCDTNTDNIQIPVQIPLIYRSHADAIPMIYRYHYRSNRGHTRFITLENQGYELQQQIQMRYH